MIELFYTLIAILFVNIIMGLLKFPVMKRPYGISFEFGFKKSFVPHIYLGPIKLGEIRPCYKVNNNYIQCENGGIKLDLTFGTVKGPFPYLWKKEFRLNPKTHYVEKESATNRWNSGNYPFVYTLPYFPAFFLGVIDFTGIGLFFLPISIGLYYKQKLVACAIMILIFIICMALAWYFKSPDLQPGFYIGAKSYEVNRVSSQLKIYKPDRNDLFVFEEGNDINYDRKDWKPVFTWASVTEQGNRYLILSASARDDTVDNQ